MYSHLNTEKKLAEACQMKWLICVLAIVSPWVHAGSIYLCRAYSGGAFWSQAHCNKNSALIESIVSVPDTLPFDQQVKLAEQQRRPNPRANAVTNTVINNSPAQSQLGECKALEAAIAQYEAMARQPQTGQMQDWIADMKKKARDRQFNIHC